MKKYMVNNTSIIKVFCKALLASVLITLLCILVFAFILNIFNLGNDSIDIVNQVIKIVSIAIGCKTFSQNIRVKKIIYFVIFAILYTLVTYLLFSILSQSFSFDITLFNDIFFSAIIGTICYFIFGKFRNN